MGFGPRCKSPDPFFCKSILIAVYFEWKFIPENFQYIIHHMSEMEPSYWKGVLEYISIIVVWQSHYKEMIFFFWMGFLVSNLLHIEEKWIKIENWIWIKSFLVGPLERTFYRDQAHGSPSSNIRKRFLVVVAQKHRECNQSNLKSFHHQKLNRPCCVRLFGTGSRWNRLSSAGPEMHRYSSFTGFVRISRKKIISQKTIYD